MLLYSSSLDNDKDIGAEDLTLSALLNIEILSKKRKRKATNSSLIKK